VIPWWWLLVSIPIAAVAGAILGIFIYLLSLLAHWNKSW